MTQYRIVEPLQICALGQYRIVTVLYISKKHFKLAICNKICYIETWVLAIERLLKHTNISDCIKQWQSNLLHSFLTIKCTILRNTNVTSSPCNKISQIWYSSRWTIAYLVITILRVMLHLCNAIPYVYGPRQIIMLRSLVIQSFVSTCRIMAFCIWLYRQIITC